MAFIVTTLSDVPTVTTTATTTVTSTTAVVAVAVGGVRMWGWDVSMKT